MSLARPESLLTRIPMAKDFIQIVRRKTYIQMTKTTKSRSQTKSNSANYFSDSLATLLLLGDVALNCLASLGVLLEPPAELAAGDVASLRRPKEAFW